MNTSLNHTEPRHASKLFTPIQVGPFSLSHRVVMAPMTRLRANCAGDLPVDVMAEYYSQRASEGGLLISEGTPVSVGGRGYLGAPGIWCSEQIPGWRKITDAVHARGGYLFMQIWHVGRSGHVDMTNGEMPVAPSVVPYEGTAYTKDGWVPTSPHRALEIGEIPGIVEDFRNAAQRADDAGLDGVEIHGANGYLLDGFLRDGTNHRTDAYGGPVENRARLMFEVLDACVDVLGAGRVGLRLSPSSTYNAMSDSDSDATFGHVAERLNPYGLAFLDVVEPRITGNDTLCEGAPPVAAHQIRQRYTGTLLAAGGFTPETAEAILARGDADLVAFGRLFTSNPDLPERIRLGLPLTPYDRSTFYGHEPRGYTDFPSYKDGSRSSG